MADVAKLVGDLTRLSVELESSKAQLGKLKAKGASKDKLAEAAASVAESEAFYAAVYEQIPGDVAKDAVKHIKKLRDAQAAVDEANAALSSAFPSEPDVSVSSAAGAAHDAAVKVEEN
jgi:hypothetical protein